MTPARLAALATRTLAAEPLRGHGAGCPPTCRYAADRERVASDLAGLRDHPPQEHDCSVREDGVNGRRGRWYYADDVPEVACPDARRYADGLRRTAALYGAESCYDERIDQAVDNVVDGHTGKSRSLANRIGRDNTVSAPLLAPPPTEPTDRSGGA